MELHDRLWNDGVLSATYGDDRASYHQALLDQYKLYVEMADRVSQRRGLANTFFLTLNTAIFAVIGVFWKDRPDGDPWWLIVPTVAVLGQCFAWFYLVRSYRLLNSAKFMVVGWLEERLPTRPWSTEWARLSDKQNRSTYWPLSHIEKWIPTLFGAAYVGGFIGALATAG